MRLLQHMWSHLHTEISGGTASPEFKTISVIYIRARIYQTICLASKSSQMFLWLQCSGQTLARLNHMLLVF